MPAVASVLAKNTCESEGRGLFWDEKSKRLYYIDIDSGSVQRYDTEKNTNEQVILRKCFTNNSLRTDVVINPQLCRIRLLQDTADCRHTKHHNCIHTYVELIVRGFTYFNKIYKYVLVLLPRDSGCRTIHLDCMTAK
jgi:hypothetical protein